MRQLTQLVDSGLRALKVLTPGAGAPTVVEPVRPAPETRAITPFKDPFQSRCVEQIHIHIYTGQGRFSASMNASVEFTNGDTSGRQEFKADTLEELLLRIKFFIQTIDQK